VHGGSEEEAIVHVGFVSVYALRPSMIDGKREESRLPEQVGLPVMRALGPLLGKYRPTPVEAIALAMVVAAKTPKPGVHVVEADAIFRTSGVG
jgi:hypothetical protein